jgi:hypothetical protein
VRVAATTGARLVVLLWFRGHASVGLLTRVAVKRLNFRISARFHAARSTDRQSGRLQRKAPLQPLGRPLELIASDARRLGPRIQNPPRGTSFAKLEGARLAYDHVLVEACTALGVAHLLEVLPPGDELDRERSRVEGVLWLSGLRIDETA